MIRISWKNIHPCLVLTHLEVEQGEPPGARVHCAVITGRHGGGGDTQEGGVGGGRGEVHQLGADGGAQLCDQLRGRGVGAPSVGGRGEGVGETSVI